jgi:hypothetical protein
MSEIQHNIYTIGAIALRVKKPPEMVEKFWRRAKIHAKGEDRKGDWLYILRTTLKMLGWRDSETKHIPDKGNYVDVCGVRGKITEVDERFFIIQPDGVDFPLMVPLGYFVWCCPN